jgi:RNA recognition motif-containing protein
MRIFLSTPCFPLNHTIHTFHHEYENNSRAQWPTWREGRWCSQPNVSCHAGLVTFLANIDFFHRLYLKNLPDKLKKPDLRLSLYTLFSTYGPVLDVVVMKTAKMRGQGHVVFRDVQASTQAMRALQGFDFYGKELVRRFSLHILRIKLTELCMAVDRICQRKLRCDQQASRYLRRSDCERSGRVYNRPTKIYFQRSASGSRSG